MPESRRFRDRTEAGRLLGEALRHHAGRPGVLVLALPRGGVPVGFEVAQALGCPLEVFVVRKLGVPGQEELAMGAIASGGARFLNTEVLEALQLPPEAVEEATRSERRELDRRERLYRGDRPAKDLEDRIAILVDDGLATGSSMRAAILALREHRPRRIVVAVPVAARETCDLLANEVDELVCLRRPEAFRAVGLWYEDFEQTTDEEVRELVHRAAAHRPPAQRSR